MEKKLEQKLVYKIKALGGLCLKLLSTFFTGLPDRLVLMPGGRIYFVELKNGNRGVLSPRQAVVHKLLERLGFKVWIVKDNETLNKFIGYVESFNSL